MLGIAAIVLSLAIVSWAYGVYCYVQMVRHRQPGVPAFSLIWPTEKLTLSGVAYRRQALLSYGVFVALAVVLILVGRFSEP